VKHVFDKELQKSSDAIAQNGLPSHPFMAPQYLMHGNPRQRESYAVLKKLGIFEQLSAFTPVLAGTVPLDIDIAGSDLDILLEVYDLESAGKLLSRLYGHLDRYSCRIKDTAGTSRIVARFGWQGWPVEIFGMAEPVERQNGYRHMVVEARILQLLGEKAKEQIRMMKRKGLKTEPAFAALLGLQGDPYEELLRMYYWSDEEFGRLVDKWK
jgi:hypothetical protein